MMYIYYYFLGSASLNVVLYSRLITVLITGYRINTSRVKQMALSTNIVMDGIIY